MYGGNMLGTSFAGVDMSAVLGGFTALPDHVSQVLTLTLRNNDNYSSEYGLKGTDYDYKMLVRNTRESPKVGSPLITRHNVELQVTKRATVSAGVVTPAIPYVFGMTARLPETGLTTIETSMIAFLCGSWLNSAGSKWTKLYNFES
jgi:hypothetical protein